MSFNSLKTAIAKLKKETIAEQEPYYGAAICGTDGMWELKCGNRPELDGLYTEAEINEIDARPDTRIFGVRLHREGYAGPDKPNYLDGSISSITTTPTSKNRELATVTGSLFSS